MKISFTERFQKDLSSLEKEKAFEALLLCLKLPKALKDVHQHSGLGLRKIHSGLYEIRLGLKLRLLFYFGRDEVILDRICNHDEVKRFLKNL